MIENGQGQFMKDIGEETFQKILEWVKTNNGTRQQCADAVGVSRSTVMRHLPRVKEELENKK